MIRVYFQCCKPLICQYPLVVRIHDVSFMLRTGVLAQRHQSCMFLLSDMCSPRGLAKLHYFMVLSCKNLPTIFKADIHTSLVKSGEVLIGSAPKLNYFLSLMQGYGYFPN